VQPSNCPEGWHFTIDCSWLSSIDLDWGCASTLWSNFHTCSSGIDWHLQLQHLYVLWWVPITFTHVQLLQLQCPDISTQVSFTIPELHSSNNSIRTDLQIQLQCHKVRHWSPITLNDHKFFVLIDQCMQIHHAKVLLWYSNDIYQIISIYKWLNAINH